MVTLTKPTVASNPLTSVLRSQIENLVVQLLTAKPLPGQALQKALPHYQVEDLIDILAGLTQQGVVRLNADYTYELVPQQTVQTAHQPFSSLTIQVPPGLLRDLKGYAKQQGTSVELEASWLLGEIVRLYKAQRVITTR